MIKLTINGKTVEIEEGATIMEAAAKADPSFNVNVEALKAAQPRELTASEIDVRLGATWIEPRYIEQFMVETFQPTYWASRSMRVNYSQSHRI